jgi:hypothetical protein
MDEAIPAWVKQHYSPRESWKSKPFSKEDAGFFFKGIQELSDLFTDERPNKGMPQYFLHPKYRSSYLLYFLPLQAAKFSTIFQLHSKAIEAALKHAHKRGVLRVADLGAGPGTASLSLLLFLLSESMKTGETLPQIEMDWFDSNSDIMEDGKGLIEQFADHFPRLRGKVQVRTHKTPWWKAPQHLPDELSLVFMGHVLNESTAPKSEFDVFWENLIPRAQGGGILYVEPAARKPAQVLSNLRNYFFESGLVDKSPTRIWGPCLHAESCPLSDGRDWCHFSVEVQIPGKWFKGFSEGLGSERHWVKYSYFWLASAQEPAPKKDPKLRRVISDPLNQGPKANVLICEPDQPGRWTAPGREKPRRGDLVKVQREPG